MDEDRELEIRTAVASDCRFVWETNNHPSVRQQSITTDDIPWEDHQVWFESALNEANRVMLIAEAQSRRVGVVRFDLDMAAQEALVTIALIPSSRGGGLGRLALSKSSVRILSGDNINVVSAYIRTDNVPSQRAFEASGFTRTGHVTIKGVRLARFELKELNDEQ
jgi:RimJ/RimL family protein N-acetyltransferase